MPYANPRKLNQLISPDFFASFQYIHTKGGKKNNIQSVEICIPQIKDVEEH